MRTMAAAAACVALIAIGGATQVRAQAQEPAPPPPPASSQAPAPPQPAGDAGLASTLGLTGSLRAAYWSSSRSLDDRDHFGAATLWVKMAPSFGHHASARIEGWLQSRGTMDGRATAKGADELREAQVDLRVRSLDLRIGRQIIAWGRADRINPTDNLTPRDFTVLVSDDDDERRGTTAVRGTYFLGSVSVTGVWLPEFRPHELPLPAPPGLSIVERTPGHATDQWAAKVEQTGGRVDWSLSYFDGFDLYPDLQPVSSTLTPTVALAFHRVHIVGGDAATTLGRIGMRAEAAYVDTDDPDGRDPFVKNPFFMAVVGGDRTFREHLNINVQYFVRRVRASHPVAADDELARFVARQQAIVSSQVRDTQHGASLRVSHKWLHETLEAELAAVGTLAPDGATLRPKVSYAVTDRWRLIFGAQLLRGESSSLFGLQRANSTAFVEMRWSF